MSTARCSVVVADDHKIIRASIEALLETSDTFELVGRAMDGREALTLIGALQPQLALLDVSMPGLTGLEVLQAMAGTSSATRALLLTASLSEGLVDDAMQYGAWGLLSKDQASTRLLPALRAVIRGEKSFPQSAKASSTGREAARDNPLIAGLTELERKIGALVGEGLRNHEICNDLGLSERDLKLRLHTIFEKLCVPDRGTLAAVMAARRLRP
jgi:two-component system nitrate/nitrite response regulator NarL